MLKFLVACALIVALAGAARAQCCGDCGGDGQVTINDLITAVNNALAGCPGGPTATVTRTGTPTRRPTATRRATATRTAADRCPFDFESGGAGSCGYRGRFNQGCGNELASALLTNGSTVVVVIDTMLQNPPAIYFAAEVVDGDSAELFAWSTDNFNTSVHPTAGAVEFIEDRSRLVIFPNDPPFMIQSCNFVRYEGVYLGNSGASAALNGEALPEEVVERLREWRERPVPEIAE
jgi:hypothetical protein